MKSKNLGKSLSVALAVFMALTVVNSVSYAGPRDILRKDVLEDNQRRIGKLERRKGKLPDHLKKDLDELRKAVSRHFVAQKEEKQKEKIRQAQAKKTNRCGWQKKGNTSKKSKRSKR
jgi:hypothetical protein